ncbi:MAG: hypothetical protein ACTSRS_02405 [Candidatus Helarchaeota archaeon]
MTSLQEIKNKVLPFILPTDKETTALEQITETITAALWDQAKYLSIYPAFIQNHGSTGIKQTHLRGASDLDIFIGLNPTDYSHYLELPLKQRKQALKELFSSYVMDWFIPAIKNAGFSRYQISYAEHPYLTTQSNNYEIDIVGCFDLDYDFLLTKGPITAVDRTPWHSKIVAEKLNTAQKNDARLLKAFFQANFVYGDKNTLGRFGFTGFSAEMLILYFEDLTHVFSKFETLRQTPLDFFQRSPRYLRSSRRFQNDFLIIIDPVDKSRNLASSISKRAYNYALFRIQQFLKSPNVQYFLKTPLSATLPRDIIKYSSHVVVIEFLSDGSLHYTEIRDKLYSLAEKLRKSLEKETTGEPRFGKTFYELYFENNTFSLVFFCTHPQISAHYLRRGPPKHKTENIQQFLAKHPSAFIKDNYFYVYEKRAYQSPLSLVRDFLQKAKTIKGLTLNSISQLPSSDTSKKATNLMFNHVLPLYGLV